LFDLLEVMRGVHEDLVSGVAPSVPAALNNRRRAILAGVVVVFSGGLLRDSHQPERCAPWRMAVALGATCDVKMDVSRVTHVISSNGDTGSVRKALLAKRKIHAVSLEWLQDSAVRWHRQSEAGYTWSGDGGAGSSSSGGPCGDPDPLARLDLVKTLLPPILEGADGQHKKLSAVIRYVMPASKKVHAERLIQEFQVLEERQDDEGRGKVLLELTKAVGGKDVMIKILEMVGF